MGSLKKKYENLHSQIDVMGNGYPQNNFKPNHTTPEELKCFDKPVIMYLGTIRDWIDFNVVKQLVATHIDKQFVFIGPVVENVQTKIDELRTFTNFLYLGKKERYEVPKYMAAADLAIIPYLENKFTASVKPIKLYEFLSCGTPVITTTSADISANAGAIYISSLEKLSTTIELALMESCSLKCIDMAKPWSWKSVANSVIQKLNLV